MSHFASSVSTNPKDEAPGDAALLHLLDGYYIKRHSVKAWNTSGGYCDVFTGDHPTFGKVALKRPRGDQYTDKQSQSFKREALIWKELHHPNILQFVGLIDTPSDVWLVSIFATNGTLHKYMRSHQKADRRCLVLQFTSGLAYLHSRTVIHGDLKSDNLLISANHQLLIADFGLSKLSGMSTDTSKKGAGSIRWMAPELLEGEEEEAIKTSSSDVYAYGITISEILCGELPFKQYTNMISLVRAVLGNKRPPIPESAQGSPYAILWATAKDCWDAVPAKRPTMVDVCRRFFLDYTRPVDGAIASGITLVDEMSYGSGPVELGSSRPEDASSLQRNSSHPQSVNPDTGSSHASDNRLLQLLGNAEHGDTGYMLDDGICLEGTRVEILDKLDTWADGQSSPRIMLLKGQAGRGKSTIARSVSSRYRKRWKDDASSAIFHFRRGNEGLNTRPFLALARQLGSSPDRRVRLAIFKSIQDHQDVAQLRLEEQFEVLFVQPLRQLEVSPPRILLVIDALDECPDRSLISALLRMIRQHIPSLPSTIKFLLTTRPEEHIVGPFKAFSDSDQEDLDAIDLALIDRDVRSYFITHLSDVQQEYGFNADWLPPKAINELVSLSQGLFQWANAAMEYVRERPVLNLRRLIRSPTNLLGLPALYKQILSTAFPLRKDIKDDSSFLALIQYVIGFLVVAHRPMSPAILEYLWDNMPGHPPVAYPAIEIRDGILGRLGSILILPRTPGGPVHFMHASVRDFFTDPAQCDDKRFLIDPSVHHERLAFRCFDRMRKSLKQSIRDINAASEMKSETIGVVAPHLSSGLQFCCRSWATHIAETRADGSSGFLKAQREMQVFCTEQLPYWIEGLSLTGVLTEAFDMIRRATNWIKVTKLHSSPSVTTLLSDTDDFCRQFFKHMSTYPRHISLSYLLQFQSETALRDVYSDLIGQQALRIVRGPTLKRDWSRVIHSGSAVLCVAFSPDGKTLACGLIDSTIRLWNMDTGEPIDLPLVGHENPVNGLAFSPDGKTLASGSDDAKIRLWNMDTREPKGMPLIGHKDRVMSVAYSPDGNTLASGSFDTSIRLWNLGCEEPIGIPYLGHYHPVTSVAYSPSGKSIASGSDAWIQLWTIDSDSATLSQELAGRVPSVKCVTLSPDGKLLAFASSEQPIWLRNMDTGRLMDLPPIGIGSCINGLAFSPDSKTLASGSNGTAIQLWDVGTRQPKGTPFIGHQGQVTSVAYSPDGKTLASGSYDRTLRLWTIPTGSGRSVGMPPVGHKGRVTSVALVSDNKLLVSGSDDHEIQLWDTDTGKPKGALIVDHKTSIALASDNMILVSGFDDHKLQLWDMGTGKPKGALIVGHKTRGTSIALSSNRKILATESDGDQIQVWNFDTGALMGTVLVGPKNHVNCVDYSPDGKTLTVGLDNGIIRSWTVAIGQRQRLPWPFITHNAQGKIPTPLNGKTFATTSEQHHIQLWNIDTGKQKGPPFFGHKTRVTSIALSSDGKILASGSSDNEIRLWDIQTRASEVAPLRSHNKDCVRSLAFSLDDQTLASGSDSGMIWLWEFTGGRSLRGPLTHRLTLLFGGTGTPELCEKPKSLIIASQGKVLISSGPPVWNLAFSPSGTTLASGSDDNTIRLWDVSTGTMLRSLLGRHQNQISSLAFSSDGEMIAAGSIDGTIRLWTAASGQKKELPPSGHQGYVASVAFSPDGGTLVSRSNLESGDEIIHWNLNHRDTTKSATSVDDKDSDADKEYSYAYKEQPDAKMQEMDAEPQELETDLEVPDANLENGSLHDVSCIRLDLNSAETYERGWVFIRGKRCFWLPPEFYLDQDDHRVDISLLGARFLVFHHPNIHILDISALL